MEPTLKSLPEALERLLSTPAVSGLEAPTTEVAKALFEEAGAESVELDLTGNLFAWKGHVPTRALMAHLDTVGFMVSAHDEDCTKLRKVGYTLPAALQRGRLDPRSGDPISGLILANAKDGSLAFEPDCPSQSARISIGDRISYDLSHHFDGERLVGPYLDNRLGIYMALEAFRQADNLLVVLTVQEETSGMGAYHARDRMQDIEDVLIVDVTYARSFDVPDNPLELGKGPVLSLKDSSMPHPEALEMVRAAAEEAKVELQLEVEDEGGSDLQAMIQARKPFRSCFFGVPSRYNHQPFEMVDFSDVGAAIRILEVWSRGP